MAVCLKIHCNPSSYLYKMSLGVIEMWQLTAQDAYKMWHNWQQRQWRTVAKGFVGEQSMLSVGPHQYPLSAISFCNTVELDYQITYANKLHMSLCTTDEFIPTCPHRHSVDNERIIDSCTYTLFADVSDWRWRNKNSDWHMETTRL